MSPRRAKQQTDKLLKLLHDADLPFVPVVTSSTMAGKAHTEPLDLYYGKGFRCAPRGRVTFSPATRAT